MKAMIFAAGLGTRLKPITDNIPKALLPLGGKTLLEYQIDRLKKAGVSQIVVNVHHFADKIISYLQENNDFSCSIQISDERDELLDTGGGLRKARSLLCENNGDGRILCMNVDILSNIDISAFINTDMSGIDARLVVSERQTQRYLLFDESGRMVGWTNQQTGEVRPPKLVHNADISSFKHLAFSGMQLLTADMFPLLDGVAKEKGDKFSLIDLYLSICQTREIRSFVPSDYKMMDVGKINQLSEAERFARELY